MYSKIFETTKSLIGDGVTGTTVLANAANIMLGDKFNGVFAQDQFTPTSKPYSIVNTDMSNSPGVHWIAIADTKLRDQEGERIYMMFDSFGRKARDIVPLIASKYNIMETEHDVEQKKTQNSCGARSLAFLKTYDTIRNPEIMILM